MAKVLQNFKFAHGGRYVEEYQEGQEIDLEKFDEEFISVVMEEGWVEGSSGGAKAKRAKSKVEGVKAEIEGAPENK